MRYSHILYLYILSEFWIGFIAHRQKSKKQNAHTKVKPAKIEQHFKAKSPQIDCQSPTQKHALPSNYYRIESHTSSNMTSRCRTSLNQFDLLLLA